MEKEFDLVHRIKNISKAYNESFQNVFEKYRHYELVNYLELTNNGLNGEKYTIETRYSIEIDALRKTSQYYKKITDTRDNLKLILKKSEFQPKHLDYE